MVTLIDLFNAFSSRAISENYPTSARVLMYTLMHEWNSNQRQAETKVSRSALINRAGLNDTTFDRAFAFLAQRGWCKWITSGKRRTGFLWGIVVDTVGQKRDVNGGSNVRTPRDRAFTGRKPPSAAFNPNLAEERAHAQDNGTDAGIPTMAGRAEKAVPLPRQGTIQESDSGSVPEFEREWLELSRNATT